jgi:hypothetical protein
LIGSHKSQKWSERRLSRGGRHFCDLCESLRRVPIPIDLFVAPPISPKAVTPDQTSSLRPFVRITPTAFGAGLAQMVIDSLADGLTPVWPSSPACGRP